MKIYLVRHGETYYNVEGRFQGQGNLPLNEKGIEQVGKLSDKFEDMSDLNEVKKLQAEKLGVRFQDKIVLKGEKITAIYSSPLSRTMTTAEAIGSKHNLEPKPEQGLIEMDMGEWEGKTAKQVMEEYKTPDGSPLLMKWKEDPVNYHIPGGEKAVELDHRVTTTIHKIIQNHQPGENIILVTHMGPIAIALNHVLRQNLKDVQKIKVDNASVTVIEIDDNKLRKLQDKLSVNEVGNPLDEASLLVMNDISHLKI